MASPGFVPDLSPLDFDLMSTEERIAAMPGVRNLGGGRIACSPDVAPIITELRGYPPERVDAVPLRRVLPLSSVRGHEKLYGFQKEDAVSIATGAKRALWLCTGGGKSPIGIAALALAGVKHALIVTKASGRESYVRDAAWIGDFKVGMLIGEYNEKPSTGQLANVRKANKLIAPLVARGSRSAVYLNATEALADGCQLIVCGWETLASIDVVDFTDDQGVRRKRKDARLRDDLRVQWDALALDEAHMMKSSDSQRSVAAMEAVGFAGWVFEATATSVPDRLRDLHSQLRAIAPDAWGRTSWKFVKWHCHARGTPFGGLDTTGPCSPKARCAHCLTATAELRRRCHFWVSARDRRVISSELPPKRREIERIPASEVSRSIKRLPPSERRGLQGALAVAADAVTPRASEKAAEWLASRGKVLLIGNRHSWLPKIIEAVRAEAKETRHVREHCWFGVATGVLDATIRQNVEAALPAGVKIATTPMDRTALAREYMEANGPAVLFGTMDAMSDAIDLQDTDWMGVCALPVTPRQRTQLEGRVSRPGQKRSVLITYYVPEGTIAEKIEASVLSKEALVDAVGADTMLGNADNVNAKSERAILDDLSAWLKANAGDYDGGDASDDD